MDDLRGVLANVYLHYVLDLWFERIIKRRCRGEANIVRYADDFVCCFQNKDEAEKFLEVLKDRLKKFGLEIAEDKTKIIEFGRFAEENRRKRGEGKPEKFDFLGFTHICSKTRSGKFAGIVDHLWIYNQISPPIKECKEVFIIWSDDSSRAGLIVDDECWGIFDIKTKRKMNAPRNGNCIVSIERKFWDYGLAENDGEVLKTYI